MVQFQDKFLLAQILHKQDKNDWALEDFKFEIQALWDYFMLKGTDVAQMSLSVVNREDGFTWLELIVIILIAGILASISYSKYISIYDSVKVAKCKNNQMTLESTQRLFYAQKAMTTQAEYATELNDLIPYIKEGKLPDCPSNGQYVLKAGGVISCTEPDHQR